MNGRVLVFLVLLLAVSATSDAQLSNSQAVGLYTYSQDACGSPCVCCLVSTSPDDSSRFALGVNIFTESSTQNKVTCRAVVFALQ